MGAIGMANRGLLGAMDDGDELIARARTGEQEAFQLIFQRYAKPILRFVFYMVNDRGLAEDLCQETFVRAYLNLASLRNDTRLSTWLFGIARNVARESLRSHRHEAQRVEFEQTAKVTDCRPSPDHELLDREMKDLVRRALGELDEDQRLVFTLKVYEQQSYDEIAEITGFSIPKVRNDLYRARAEMRTRLASYMRKEGTHEMS
jgi:RNA polymerase sigma-70 factor (ECF subfamily)